jgi:hypothetical protein
MYLCCKVARERASIFYTAQTLVDIRPPISPANWAGDKRQNNLFGHIEVIISGGKCSHVGSRRL